MNTSRAYFQPDRCADCMVGQGDACHCRDQEPARENPTVWDLLAIVLIMAAGLSAVCGTVQWAMS